MSRCSRLPLWIYCPDSRISHFSKESDTFYAECYCTPSKIWVLSLLSHLSQQSREIYVGVLNHVYTFIYKYLYSHPNVYQCSVHTDVFCSDYHKVLSGLPAPCLFVMAAELCEAWLPLSTIRLLNFSVAVFESFIRTPSEPLLSAGVQCLCAFHLPLVLQILATDSKVIYLSLSPPSGK